ncbi:MAG: ATP-binding domain-containing protein, partial [Lachnospiraceae bacterium]|nr:ATP-binding domain-containing protein [Lachnospiraceae bacterium]
YVDRKGKEPLCIWAKGKKDAKAKVEEVLKEVPQEKSIGILTCDGDSAWDVRRMFGNTIKEERPIQYILAPDKTMEEKIIAMPIMLAKGLEFDVVIVWDDRSENYWEENKNLRYLMATRALHELYFVSFEK